MSVFIYAPTKASEKNLKQILERLFPNSLRFRDMKDNHQHLVTLVKPPHIDVKIQGLVRLFEFNNPKDHYASVCANVAAAINKYKWDAHAEKIGTVLSALDAWSDVLVYLNGSTFAVTNFRPHPHPHMRTRGLTIATGPGLPNGGIVRVGAGNLLYSQLYGHASRKTMQAGEQALINGIANLGVNVATGMIFAKLLNATGLISQAEFGKVWRTLSLARTGGKAALGTSGGN